MFDPEFLELMPFVCTLKPKVGRNIHGEATWDDAGAVLPHCHVRKTGKQIYSTDGTVRTEEGICYLDGSYDVDTTWALWVPEPGNGGGRQVNIQSVDQLSDEDGWHHTAIHFGAL
jgi:hypothetical protein